MAGRVQLAAFGTADEVLSGDPNITFWKAIYRRHTLFAMESVALTWHGTTDFGRRATCIIPKSADLISKLWLQVTLPDLRNLNVLPAGVGRIAWANNIGHVLISSIEVELGGTRIDKQDGCLMDIMSQLNQPVDKRRSFAEMIGAYDDYDPSNAAKSCNYPRVLYVPIQFYFWQVPWPRFAPHCPGFHRGSCKHRASKLHGMHPQHQHARLVRDHLHGRPPQPGRM